MAVNLIEQFGRQRTREILESSFAQFQADRGVVDLARKVRNQEESLLGYEKPMTCHLGDFREYSGLRRELTDLEKKSAGRVDSLGRGERERRQHKLAELRKALRRHPCHACSDRETHARWAERWWKLTRSTDDLRRQIANRTGAISRVFDRIADVLLELGYLSHGSDDELVVAPPGRTLRRIYGERDLLVAECLRTGAWDNLDPAGLAAMAAALVYEPRRDDSHDSDQHLSRGGFGSALERTTALWRKLAELEVAHRLPGSDPISTTISLPMHRWAQGASLESVLDTAELAAGDFVRITKQAIDLLDQLSIVADTKVGVNARAALDAIRRGIVAYSSVS